MIGEIEAKNLSETEENDELLDHDSKEEENSLDDIINSTGRGTWTYIYFMIACTFTAVEVVNLFGPVFQVPQLDFKCNETLNYNEDVMPINGNECSYWRKDSRHGDTLVETQCKYFLYNKSVYESTLTEEYDLVCSKSQHKQLYKSSYLVGSVVGCLLGGVLSDKFGRKPVLWYSSLLMTILTFLLLVVPMYELVVLIRFLMGTTTMVVSTAAYTIAMEASPASLRSAFAIAVALPFGMMVSLLALIANFTRRWRSLQLWSSVPLYMLLFFSNPYLVQESPRWLVENGKLDEAEEVLLKAARMNATTDKLPPFLRRDLEKIHLESLQFNSSIWESDTVFRRLKSLVSTWPMFKLTFIMCTIWFCQCVVYIVIPYRSDTYRSPFMYLGVLGAAECPLYLTILPLALKIKRRTCISIGFAAIAVILLAIAALDVCHINIEWLSIGLSAVGYSLASTAYMVVLVYCSELYPTSVRSTGLSTALFAGNVGCNVPVLLDYVIPSNLSWLSLVAISLLSFFTCIIVWLLPETKDTPLLQTVCEYATAAEKEGRYSHLKSSGGKLLDGTDFEFPIFMF